MQTKKESRPPEARPIYSEEAERGLLGCMIMNPSEACPEAFTLLHPEDFFVISNKLVFEAIYQLFSHGKDIDIITAKDQLSKESLQLVGGVEYIASLVETIQSVYHWKGYLQVVADKAKARKRLELLTNAREFAAAGAEQEFLEVLDSIRDFSPEGGSRSLEQVVESNLKMLDSSRTSGREMVWGWKALDDLTAGIRRGALYVLGAKTSHGKTSTLANVVVRNLKDNKRVLLCVLENPYQVVPRLAAVNAGVPLAHFLQPDLISEEQYIIAKSAIEELPRIGGELKVVEDCSMSTLGLMAERFKPDLICLDYVQQYSPPNPGKESRHREISDAARQFKRICIKVRAGGLLYSQLSRKSSESKGWRPSLPDLKESGDLECFADAVLFPYWPYRDTMDETLGVNRYEIDVAKNNIGPWGETARLKINCETLAISDI